MARIKLMNRTKFVIGEPLSSMAGIKFMAIGFKSLIAGNKFYFNVIVVDRGFNP